jgi:hypothetical protein
VLVLISAIKALLNLRVEVAIESGGLGNDVEAVVVSIFVADEFRPVGARFEDFDQPFFAPRARRTLGPKNFRSSSDRDRGAGGERVRLERRNLQKGKPE